VAAIVLAAGRSTRMAPANKLLATLPDGETMIARTVDHVLGSGARPVIVVTGHAAAAVRRALGERKIRLVHAADYAEGMAASLRAGIAALPASAGAALICLGDMPLVGPEILDGIIAAFDPTEGREIVLPSFAGKRGNPVLWGRRFFPELLRLSGDIGARQILVDYMESVVEVPAETDAVLQDFDTPEALAALAAR
jgi:molybdenum cofactor cytidylyltransferase